MNKPIIYIFLFAILLTSCNSYEKLTYLQEIQETGSEEVFKKNKPGYQLQAGDLLFIQVITENADINELFNPNLGQSSSNNLRPESMFYTGYLVSDSGYIEMPLMKRVEVDGLTVDQAQDSIALRAKRFLKDPQIIVKLANFKFAVLGEVAAPGVKQVTANQINIFEALAHAGDITYNGNRKTVLIIRQTGEGSQTYRLNLTNDDLIASDLYYIMPNDVIYVEPLGSTLFREQASDFVFVISAISSTLTAVALLLNLLN